MDGLNAQLESNSSKNSFFRECIEMFYIVIIHRAVISVLDMFKANICSIFLFMNFAVLIPESNLKFLASSL